MISSSRPAGGDGMNLVEVAARGDESSDDGGDGMNAGDGRRWVSTGDDVPRTSPRIEAEISNVNM